MSRADVMRRPPDLEGPAAEMWDRNAAELVRMGTLTSETKERYAKACRAWGDFIRLSEEDDERMWAASRLMMYHSRGFGTTPMDRANLYRAGKIGPEWVPWMFKSQ